MNGPAAAQPFTPIETTIRPMNFGMLVLGDFNRNGRLDVFAANHEIAEIYFNSGLGDLSFHALTVSPESMPSLRHNASAFAGDHNNNGHLDILFTGESDETVLYVNGGGEVFQRASNALPPIIKSGIVDVVNAPSISMADVNNDGSLDILLAGFESDGTGSGPATSRVYLNDGSGGTTEYSQGLPSVLTGPHAWGDYDGDGHLDLVSACYCQPGEVDTRIFRNDGNGRLVDTGFVLLHGIPASVQWGDYDDDGDLDLLIAGRKREEGSSSDNGIPQVEPYLAIIRNDGGSFSLDLQPLPEGVYWARWADMNNDGSLDLLVNTSVRVSQEAPAVSALRIFANDGGRFSTEIAALPAVWNGAIAIGDLDGDGDLDLILSPVLSGAAGEERLRTVVFRNESSAPKVAPQAPLALYGEFIGNDLHLTWLPPADAGTPAIGRSYNVRVGTTPGGSEVMSAMALADGTRLVPRDGNAGKVPHWVVRGVDPSREHYWSVQAIDNAFVGSAFSEEAFVGPQAVAVDDSNLPYQFGLIGNYPNPFNPRTTVRFQLASSGHVRLAVYNVYGQRVALLQDGLLAAGAHDVPFDADGLSSGVYLCRLTAYDQTDAHAVTLAK